MSEKYTPEERFIFLIGYNSKHPKVNFINKRVTHVENMVRKDFGLFRETIISETLFKKHHKKMVKKSYNKLPIEKQKEYYDRYVSFMTEKYEFKRKCLNCSKSSTGKKNKPGLV